MTEHSTLSMSATLAPEPQPMVGARDEHWDHDTWLITLRFETRSYEMRFHTGTGCRADGRPTAPTLGDILECAASDASMIDDAEDVADFADSFGMPETREDLRRLIATFEATKSQTAAMEDLFGRALFWDTVVYNGPDDGWSSVTTETISFANSDDEQD